jgi:hypothetical protein
MGEVIDITKKRAAHIERRKTERLLAAIAVGSAAILGYAYGHSSGQSSEKNKQILEVNKACFTMDRLQHGQLNIQLTGDENGIRFLVNGNKEGKELPESISPSSEPFELIC